MIANEAANTFDAPEFISEYKAQQTKGFEHTRFMTAAFGGWVYHWHSALYSPLRKQGWHRQYKKEQD